MKIDWNKYSLTSEPTAISSDYYPTTMTNIDGINDFMKDAADALDKALGGNK